MLPSEYNNPIDWYTYGVLNRKTYIDAAFRSSRTNEAYLFMKNEFVLLNYAPRTTTDDNKVVNGPLLIRDGFLSLRDTPFGGYGIDCAFGSHDEGEAFIFCGELCAQINFIGAPETPNDGIIKGPMTISTMFPFLKNTVFESSIDAAFESTTRYEAYLFKGDQYALINYGPNGPHLNAIRPITQGFPSLRGTIFESGIQAAFASHIEDEAYLFKGDSYALINFAPGGTTDDYIVSGVKKILSNWPSLRDILPRKNRGLDVNDYDGEGSADPDDYDHDRSPSEENLSQ